MMNQSQMRRIIVDAIRTMGFFAWFDNSVDIYALVHGELFVIQWTRPDEKTAKRIEALERHGAHVIESCDPKEIEVAIEERLARQEILGIA